MFETALAPLPMDSKSFLIYPGNNRYDFLQNLYEKVSFKMLNWFKIIVQNNNLLWGWTIQYAEIKIRWCMLDLWQSDESGSEKIGFVWRRKWNCPNWTPSMLLARRTKWFNNHLSNLDNWKKNWNQSFWIGLKPDQSIIWPVLELIKLFTAWKLNSSDSHILNFQKFWINFDKEKLNSWAFVFLRAAKTAKSGPF